MYNEAAIGIFDSGVGGLTVAKEVIKQIPSENIIYFGDTARVPYGNKSQGTIIRYSRQIVKFLMSKQVKAIVIACNTASAFALETIKKEVDIPIIGVIKPGAEVAASNTLSGKIGVIGTIGTIESGIYSKYIKEIRHDLNIYAKACPLFVPLIEENMLDDEITKEMARRYIRSLLDYNIDTLVLGCTHYPLISHTIREVVGNNVKLINPAYETAKVLKQVLKSNKLINSSNKKGNYNFFVSDRSNMFQDFANSILKCDVIQTESIDIEGY